MERHMGRFQLSQAGQPCSQCRWRKVRCDRGLGSCVNCQRLGLTCSSAISITALNAVQAEGRGESTELGHFARPPRLRASRACTLCRERKIRCSATSPACTACRRRGVACTYPASKHLVGNDTNGRDEGEPQQPDGSSTCYPQASVSPPSTSSGMAPPLTSPSRSLSAQETPPSDLSSTLTDDIKTALINDFFETIYPMPSYAFLHPSSTKRRCHSGQAHQGLALAISAVSTLYLSSEHVQKAATWIQIAEQDIWMHLESPTISRLQTLLLIIHHYMETGRFQRAFMLTANAARFATALRLNHERHDLDPVSQETRRRIVWVLRMVERYFSVGLAAFELLAFESIYIDFPCSEEDFVPQQAGGVGGGGDAAKEDGAFSFIIRLEAVRRDIMKLTRSVAILDEPLPSLGELLQHHNQALAEIGAAIAGGSGRPSSLLASGIDNTRDRWLPRRMLVHISWHQAHCDLYRILLPGYPEAAPHVVMQSLDPAALAAAEQQCVSHAMQVVEILTTLNHRSSHHHLLEFDTAICAYHSIRLLLFISRFGSTSSRPTPEFAASRADLCLAALRRFFPSSALVSPITDELERGRRVFVQQRQGGQSQWQQQPDATVSSELSSSTTHHERQGGQRRRRQQHTPPVRISAESSLPAAARVREQLAIHSLLRQADFLDHDADDTDNAGEAVAAAAAAAASDTSHSVISPSTQPPVHAPPQDIPPEGRPPDMVAPTVYGGEEHQRSPAGGGGLVFPGFGVVSAGDWGEPSPAAQGNMGDVGVVDPQSFFAWRGPQDWDWLLNSDHYLNQ